MARSSADDMDLKRACEVAIDVGGAKQKVELCIRVAKSRGGKAGKLGRNMAKPRVLAITTKEKEQKRRAFLRVLRYSSGELLEPVKIYKLKHLSKVEVVQNDPSGCTFMLGFDNLRSQSVAPSQWTMRNKDDRNRILICILNMCKEVLGRLPKVVGIDIVEMALWAKENTPTVVTQASTYDGAATSVVIQQKSQVTVEKDLVSEVEEEDMEALLGTYVMGVGEAEAFSERLKRELLALEAANVHALLENEPIIEEILHGLEEATICVEDMDEWLGIFNVKLRHTREDIESIESRNNMLQLQSVRNKALVEELDKLLEHFNIPSEFEACLTGGSFDEANMLKNIEACEWLAGALHNLEASILDPSYPKMRAVKEKRAELVLLKCTFVRRASEFLRNYFSSLVDFMISDKTYFSQRGQLNRPDHADLRYKCRTYARLLQYIKSLDKNCLGPLRKAYCHSLNLLLRREAREFANELRSSNKVQRNQIISLDGPLPSGLAVNDADSSAISDAYAKMLKVFIPLLVDECTFFAHFMCFDTSAFSSLDAVNGGMVGSSDNRVAQANFRVNPSNDATELGMLNECLGEMLEGIQEDFFAVIDWAYRIDPLCCISMHGITERYLSGQKADVAGLVRLLLDELETRISGLYNRSVDEICNQIEKYERNMRHAGILAYVPRFALLATRMERYVQGQARDLLDQGYTKIVSIMFVTLEKTAQIDPKHSDIVLLENYAAFQNSLYDLANVVPTLAKFYRQASESYEKACLCHVNMLIYTHFEKLFQFAHRIEEMMKSTPPEEIPFQNGMSAVDLKKMLKSNLAGVDKTISGIYRRLQKNLSEEELLPPLWDNFKKVFLEKYSSFLQLVLKLYPHESIPSVAEMKQILSLV